MTQCDMIIVVEKDNELLWPAGQLSPGARTNSRADLSKVLAVLVFLRN